MKTIFAFPGVGVKLCGKESALYCDFLSIYKPLFEEVEEFGKVNLEDLIFSTEPPKITAETDRLLSLAFSYGTSLVYNEVGIKPDGYAAYSFGIYAALAASNVLSFKDALAAMAMAEETVLEVVCNSKDDYGMVVVVGLLKEDAEKIISRSDYKTLIKVNENNDTCIVVAGLKEELVEYSKLALEYDAISANLINTTVPYHHNKILFGADKILQEKLVKLSWKDSNKKIISSINQDFIQTSKELLEFTSQNIMTPINWYNTMEVISKVGAQKVFEAGHGISLTQNSRFTGFDIEYLNIKNFRRKLGL